MYLIFDTETSGLPANFKAPASDFDNWPRLVELAWVLADEDGTEIASADHIVRPDGFEIPEAATRVHGITTEAALRDGIALEAVLAAIETDIARSRVLVAHNMSFDEMILGSEFLRAGRPNHAESVPRQCTMLLSTDYCQLPGPRGLKWPSLRELHTKLFGEPVAGAHRALADARACARCYFELRRLGVLG